MAKRRRKHHRPPPGTAPGTLAGESQALAAPIHIIAYGEGGLEEREIAELSELSALPFEVIWLDIPSTPHIETLRALGAHFGLHPLALEDALHLDQRPKCEEYLGHFYLVARSLSRGESVESEQISLFFGKGFVITIQERPGDDFEAVRERLRNSSGRIRKLGADYLAYALIDAIVDHYFPILESLEEEVDRLEGDVFVHSGESPTLVRAIMGLRGELLAIRRAAWPLREALSDLMRADSALVDPATSVWLRDCHDHLLRVIDLVESDREAVSTLMDVNLSLTNHKLNEVMKVLTLIATIFMPLGFVAGVYGMNFDRTSPWNMPELGWSLGYPFALSLMALISIGFLFYFRKKRWI